MPLRVHHALYLDETGERCHWHLPASHALESWGDLRAVDGTVSLVQPLIAPLYNTLSEIELLAAFVEGAEAKGYDILRAYWQGQPGEGDFDKRWNRALHDGVVAGTAFAPRPVKVAAGGGWLQAPQPQQRGRPRDPVPHRPVRLRRPLRQPRLAAGAAEAAQQDHLGERRLHEPEDGGEARRHPHRADRARATSTDVVELKIDGRTVKAPAWVLPGHADDAVTVHLGYGRRRAGRVGTGVGFDAYALRTSAAPWTARRARRSPRPASGR